MRCPRCQNELAAGTKVCPACGCPLPQESPARKFFSALLRAFLYVALFLAVQAAVSFGYSFILTSGMMSEYLLSGGVLTEATLEAFVVDVMDIYLGNMHTLMLLSGLITLLILVFSFRVRHKNPTEEMHIRRVPLSRAPWYAVFGIALQPAVNLLLTLLPEPLLQNFEETNVIATADAPLALELLNVVILTPVVEELIFRGLSFTRMRRGMHTAVAVLISSALFGAIHGHPVSFLYASVLGVVLAWMMLKNNDSVIAPILCHAGFNGGSYLMMALLGETDSALLFYSVILASAALLVLSGFMIFRPIPSGGERE